MRPLLLHLDDALLGQTRLLRAGLEAGARVLDARSVGPALRLWGRPRALRTLDGWLHDHPASGPELVVTGSGDFHNVTPLLLARALRASPGPVTVVHFDNHPDWVRFDDGVHCGSWVAAAARLPEVARILTVGVCSDDIAPRKHKGAEVELVADGKLEVHPWRRPARDPAEEAAHVEIAGRRFEVVGADGGSAFLDALLDRVPTENVYVTLDKDVLRPEDAVTNWDQGGAPLAFVEAALARLGAARRLIGADLLGDWSRPVYAGPRLEGWVKRAEAWLDHPRAANDADGARSVNEPVNLRLLHAFRSAA